MSSVSVFEWLLSPHSPSFITGIGEGDWEEKKYESKWGEL
jgi:hypothetical protein